MEMCRGCTCCVNMVSRCVFVHVVCISVILTLVNYSEMQFTDKRCTSCPKCQITNWTKLQEKTITKSFSRKLYSLLVFCPHYVYTIIKRIKCQGSFLSCSIFQLNITFYQLSVKKLLYCFYLFTGGLHVLATHVLQFIFLGSSGFRWPVCYFATTEAHAAELVIMVWNVINVVQSYGFKVQ